MGKRDDHATHEAKYKEIKLQGKYGDGLYAKVDQEDFDELSKYKWNVNAHGYAIRSYYEGGKPRSLFMHRQILKPQPHMVTDHINGDRLDNRKSNIRIASRAENNRNMRSFNGSTSIYKGVMWDKAKSSWQARIKNRHLGYFNSEKDAAKVYDYYAKKEYKEFARLNFPDDLLEYFEKPILRGNNTSGYVGVSWCKEKKKWHSYIKGKEGKRVFIGRYSCKHEAARAYNRKAIEIYGNDVFINEVDSGGADDNGRI